MNLIDRLGPYLQEVVHEPDPQAGVVRVGHHQPLVVVGRLWRAARVHQPALAFHQLTLLGGGALPQLLARETRRRLPSTPVRRGQRGHDMGRLGSYWVSWGQHGSAGVNMGQLGSYWGS